jgi:hypothetical protein
MSTARTKRWMRRSLLTTVTFDVWHPWMQVRQCINEPALRGVQVEFVVANHPAVETYLEVDSFGQVNSALARMNESPIDWLGILP